MSSLEEGTVLARTCAYRVPEDVLIEAPYVVALVRTVAGREVLAIAGPDGELAVGDAVTLQLRDAVGGDEQVQYWGIASPGPMGGAGS